MKLEVGCVNVPAVANTRENAVNPWPVRILHPLYGVRLAET